MGLGALTEEDKEEVLDQLDIKYKQRYLCTSIKRIVEDYKNVKDYRDYKLFGHYTDLISASKIINSLKKEGKTAKFGGFRLSREGQGGGGIYFTNQFPHEATPPYPRKEPFEVEDFTKGVLKVNYGEDRATDPGLKKRTEVFFLLGIHTDFPIHKPDETNRPHARYITKNDLLHRSKGVYESSSKEVFFNNFDAPLHMTKKRIILAGTFLTKDVSDISDNDITAARNNQIFQEGEPYTAAKTPRELREAIIAEGCSRGEFRSTLSQAPLLVGLIGGTSFFNPESESLCEWLGTKLGHEKDILFVTGGFANQAKEVTQTSNRGGRGRGAAFVLAKMFMEVRQREKRFAGVFHCLPKHDDSLKFRSVSSQDENGNFHAVKDPETDNPFGFTCFLGESVKERERFMAEIVDVLILIEGGPGAAHEARQAGAPVIPIRGTGGAAGGILNKNIQSDEDKDRLFELPVLLRTPQGAEDWLIVNGPFSNDYEKEHIADAVVRIIRTLAATNSQKETARSLIYDHLQKTNDKKAAIVGVVVAPDCPGTHYQFNHLVCRSIGKKIAEHLNMDDNDDAKKKNLVLLSVDNNAVTNSFQSSSKAIFGKEGIVFTLESEEYADDNSVNHLSTTISSVDGYEDRVRILCSLSDVVICIGGTEIEAVALNQCPEDKRILVACTGGAAAGYYGIQTKHDNDINYRIRSLCARNSSETADAVVDHLITKLTKKTVVHDDTLVKARSFVKKQESLKEIAKSQPCFPISVKYLMDADMLKQPEQPEDQYNIIVNSVSPEWQSTRLESGINKAIALVAGEELNDSLNKKTNQFKDFNQGYPTYGDVIKTPAFQLRKQGFQYVIHTVGPDCSKRDKRHEVDVFTHIPANNCCSVETKATMFATYFRILAVAHLIGLEDLRRPVNLCTVQIGTGVFKVPKEIGCEMLALALRAFTEALKARNIPIFIESMTVCLGDAYEKTKHHEVDVRHLRAIKTSELYATSNDMFVKGATVECNWQGKGRWFKGEIVEATEMEGKGENTYKIRFHDKKWFQFPTKTAVEDKKLFHAAVENCKSMPLELVANKVRECLLQGNQMILARIPAPHTKTHKQLHRAKEDIELQEKLLPPFNYSVWSKANWKKKGTDFLVELLCPDFLHFDFNEALHELSIGNVKVSLRRNLDPLQNLLSMDPQKKNTEVCEKFDAVVNPLPPELSMLNATRRGIHYLNRRLVEHEDKIQEDKVHQQGLGKTKTTFEATLKLLKEKFVTKTKGVAPTYGDVLCSPGLYFPPEKPDEVKIMHVVTPVVYKEEDYEQVSRDPVEAFQISRNEIKKNKQASTVLGATYFALYFRLFAKFAKECTSKSKSVPCLCCLELCDTSESDLVSYEAMYFALAVRAFSEVYPHNSIRIIHSLGHLCPLTEAINRTAVYMKQLRAVQNISEEALHQILLTCLFNSHGICFLNEIPMVQSKFNRKHGILRYYNQQNHDESRCELTISSYQSLKLQLKNGKFLHEKAQENNNTESVITPVKKFFCFT